MAMMMSLLFPAFTFVLEERSAGGAGAGAPAAMFPGVWFFRAVEPFLDTVDGSLAVAWVIFSAVMMLGFVASAIRVRLASRAWGSTEVEGVSVLVSENVGPAVIGALGSRIVIPRRCYRLQQRPQSRRVSVVAQSQRSYRAPYRRPAQPYVPASLSRGRRDLPSQPLAGSCSVQLQPSQLRPGDRPVPRHEPESGTVREQRGRPVPDCALYAGRASRVARPSEVSRGAGRFVRCPVLGRPVP